MSVYRTGKVTRTNTNWSVSRGQTERSRQTCMRISTPHLHALLHVKKVIEQMKAMKQMPFTQREREELCESLERAYDRAESLLTTELMQALASETTIRVEKTRP